MVDVPAAFMERVLEPQPAPPGMTSREIVRRAIEFDGPPRLPYSFLVPFKTDFFEGAILKYLQQLQESPKAEAEFGEIRYDEWGVGYEVTGRYWDHSIDYPLRDLKKLSQYRFPDVAAPKRYKWMAPYLEQARDAGKYIIGADPINVYERLRQLMGFEELMLAPYTQRDEFEVLLDRLTDLTIEIIDQWHRAGPVDAFMTWDDFGLQTTLQIKLETFREFYKPRYARMAEAAHRNGMHYIFHNCGYIIDMIPDMIELGVDVVQLDQPRLMGHERLASEFGGKLCFWNTVDIQWSTSDSVSLDDIRTEVAEMTKAFAHLNGGLMARHYPQPQDIHLSNEAQIAIYEAFLEHGCGL